MSLPSTISFNPWDFPPSFPKERLSTHPGYLAITGDVNCDLAPPSFSLAIFFLLLVKKTMWKSGEKSNVQVIQNWPLHLDLTFLSHLKTYQEQEVRQIHNTAQMLCSVPISLGRNMGAGERQRTHTMTHLQTHNSARGLQYLENNIALQRSTSTYLVKIRNGMAPLNQNYS